MANLRVGPKHDPMIVDDPLCCSGLPIYTRKESPLIFIPLYLQKIKWSGRVRMQGMGRHTALFVVMADRLN